LCLPAPEVPSATYRYGKGLYFTDCFSKVAVSLANKSKSGGGDIFILLSEVALGDMHKVYKPT
jgi:hypothetical protein